MAHTDLHIDVKDAEYDSPVLSLIQFSMTFQSALVYPSQSSKEPLSSPEYIFEFNIVSSLFRVANPRFPSEKTFVSLNLTSVTKLVTTVLCIVKT